MNDAGGDTKAIAEATKAASEATGELVRFARDVFGGPLRAASGIAEGWIKYLQFESSILIYERVRRRLKQKGITDYRKVAPRLGIALIENGFIEDQAELQDLWVGLISNALDPDSEVIVTKAFVSVLSELTPLDAQTLRLLHEDDDVYNERETKLNLNDNGKPRLASIQGVPEVDIELALTNLERVGCVANIDPAMYMSEGENPITYLGFRLFTITEFGRRLVAACT